MTLNSTSSVNNNTYTSQTFPLTFTGARRLFLVFRAVPGGPATGFGNLNWVGFTGPGAGVDPLAQRRRRTPAPARRPRLTTSATTIEETKRT